METMSGSRMKYTFSDYVFDVEAHSLTHRGVEQGIEPLVFDLLHLLLRNSGKLVTRDQMVDDIWQCRIVSESSISACIAAARRAVGDDGKTQSVIRTIPRRGLQFVARMTCEQETGVSLANQIPPPTIKYATADDGVKLAYAVSGQGPPILRIAHEPSHLEMEWNDPTQKPLFDALGQSRTLVRYDHRGCGLSDIEVVNMGVERSAEDANTIADAAALERFALFGTSSGAMIAVELAARYPERVSHLVLLGGYVDGRSVRENGRTNVGVEPIVEMTRAGWDTPGSAFIKAYMSIYFPTASAETLESWANIAQSSCPAENAIRAREMCSKHSIAHLLGKVTVPTLIMHGHNDAVHPLSEAQKMARGIPNAELLVLETANHYPLPDEPSWQIHIDAMLEFLKRDIVH
jgi:pimeloyl-ACP methyl ester carboxylesterase